MCLHESPHSDSAAARARHRAFRLSPVQIRALQVDAEAARVARGQGAIELALGELLVEMSLGDRFLQIGPSCLADYADEHMGMPPRLARMWCRLARELKSRPLLRQAVMKGVVTPRKALTVLPVAVGREEPLWTAAAMSCRISELEAAVRSEGQEPPGDAKAMELLWMRLDGFGQDHLDKAIAVARQGLGASAPTWQCLEAIAMETLSMLARHMPEMEMGSGEEEGPRMPARETRRWKRKMRKRRKQVARQLAAIELAEWVLTEEPEEGWNALALHGAIQKLLEQRKAFDAVFGVLALRVVREEVWAVLGDTTFEDYCRNRLGMAPGTVKQRVWLERKMERLPALREALAKGRITYSKALVIARHALPSDVEDRIATAAATTCQQTRKKSERERAKKNRAKNVREEWAPYEAAKTWRTAIEAVQAWWAATNKGEVITPGWAVTIMAGHFVQTYGEPLDPISCPENDRRRVIARNEGICAVPGCSRSACHAHHIRYRSRGGGDEAENLVGLCSAHHLRGVHLGYMTVRGSAGEHLVWHFSATGKMWITRGDADVRRREAG